MRNKSRSALSTIAAYAIVLVVIATIAIGGYAGLSSLRPGYFIAQVEADNPIGHSNYQMLKIYDPNTWGNDPNDQTYQYVSVNASCVITTSEWLNFSITGSTVKAVEC